MILCLQSSPYFHIISKVLEIDIGIVFWLNDLLILIRLMQAITNTRVPIVKMTDLQSGISCDICINNLLAVANTKLLRDYSTIDNRMHQLSFIVKLWARSREVNKTYQDTLSSYTWVMQQVFILELFREEYKVNCFYFLLGM